ncbi:MAG: hypothetical protein AB7P04_04340 [Bacteriovoracia bacterium]
MKSTKADGARVTCVEKHLNISWTMPGVWSVSAKLRVGARGVIYSSI